VPCSKRSIRSTKRATQNKQQVSTIEDRNNISLNYCIKYAVVRASQVPTNDLLKEMKTSVSSVMDKVSSLEKICKVESALLLLYKIHHFLFCSRNLMKFSQGAVALSSPGEPNPISWITRLFSPLVTKGYDQYDFLKKNCRQKFINCHCAWILFKRNQKIWYVP
jgi:hypothetical protein